MGDWEGRWSHQHMSSPKLVILETGLFADAETLNAALATGPAGKTVTLQPATMTDADWDNVLEDILSADKVITI